MTLHDRVNETITTLRKHATSQRPGDEDYVTCLVVLEDALPHVRQFPVLVERFRAAIALLRGVPCCSNAVFAAETLEAALACKLIRPSP